jgi:D-alanyl-D-alanine carboxypeptidase
MKSRTAIAVNCEGDIVFSQRPFTPIPLASVTKTMTGLLTCEAVGAGFDTTQIMNKNSHNARHQPTPASSLPPA